MDQQITKIFEEIFESSSLFNSLEIKITELIEFITSKENPIKERVNYLYCLTNYIKDNRYLAVYFATINNASIYIALIDLFLNKDETNLQLKDNILHCIDAFIINVEIPKQIYEYIYQQISLLYRNVKAITRDNINSYLILLCHLYGDTQLAQNPKSYFTFCGKGKMEIQMKKELKIPNAISFIIAFKPNIIKANSSLSSINAPKKSELIHFECNNNQTVILELDISMSITIKNRNAKFTFAIQNDEWIQLIAIFVPTSDHGVMMYLFSEGDKTNVLLENFKLEQDTAIVSMSCFKDFIGEVGSVCLLNQYEKGYPGILCPKTIEGIVKFREGIWKKSKTNQFLAFLRECPSLDPSKRSFFSKKKEEKDHTLFEDLLFIFSPYTCKDKTIEGVFGNFTGVLTKYAKVHAYKVYQKRINLIGGIKVLLPIAEMILLNQSILCEDIMHNYLQIIYTILKDRKNNMKDAYTSEFFKLLSLFIEKYKANIFTEKILMKMIDIAKVMFSETVPELPSVFFDNILLNEKILSKYSQALHNNFWTEILDFFCQSDITQIESYLNMKKICLVLRYYDETKYYEMCCNDHYTQFKPKFVGNSKIMSPTMISKLLYLKEIIILIFENTSNLEYSDSPSTLFSLLTLDLSPCLSKFIIEIFISSAKTKGLPIIKNLFRNNFIYIIANTMRHCLLNERILIIKLLYVVVSIIFPQQLFSIEQNQLCKMLKTCLLPNEIFIAEQFDVNIDDFSIREIASHCAIKLTENQPSNFDKINIDTELVLDDDKYNDYLQHIYCLLINWSVGEDITADNLAKSKLNIKGREIKYLFTIEILLHLSDQRCSKQFTLDLVKDFEMLIENPTNCKMILLNIMMIGWLLDTTFYHLQMKADVISNNIYNSTRKTLINILIEAVKNGNDDRTYCLASNTSLPVINVSSAHNPILLLEHFLIWGNKTRSSSNDTLALELISDIIYQFALLFMPLIHSAFFDNQKKTVNQQDKDKDYPQQNKNEYLKDSFLFFCSFIYNYYCHYKNEPFIITKGLDILKTNSDYIIFPEGYLSGMNFSTEKATSYLIENFWIDYKFFDLILKELSYMWSKENTFKNYTKRNVPNRVLKYESIIKEIILNKSGKNAFLPELRLLCREVRLNDKVIQIPLIKIFLTTFSMLIIASQIHNKEDKQLVYWLKSFKNFLRFLIIGSSNITLINQLELYNAMTDKCIDSIVFGICFLKDEYIDKPLYKNRFKKTLTSIISFCFLIVQEQLAYIESHKSLLKISLKPARNDLVHCAVFRIFHEFAVNSENQPILTSAKIKDNYSLQNIKCVDELLKEEWKIPLFANQILKNRIEKNIFALNIYYGACVERYKQVSFLTNEIDLSYLKQIMELVPQYEIELEKYSNNSFILQKQKRNTYKNVKKQLFTWRGIWSDRDLFFTKIHNLKVKMVNHYTKFLSRPLLSPILDLEYYIPKFTNFSNEQMFRDYNEYKGNFKYNLDIDSIIKTKNEKDKDLEIKTNSNIHNNDLNAPEPRDNYIKDIYRKSNADLANMYWKIRNKLDFRKDDEFIDIFQKTSTAKSNQKAIKRRHYYCCFVKPSHHIKGMMFVEENEIIFRVFLNQKKADVLADINIGINDDTIDEDYDEDRNTCYGSFFVCHHKDKDLLTFSISYEHIKFFLRKRYYYKCTGIEIFSKANKSYYFNFKKEEDREQVISDILSCVKEFKQIKNDLKDIKDEYDYVMGYETFLTSENKKLKKIKLSDKVNKWYNWEISTFELLMWLNLYSNRSFSDLSQYPVMPWILNNYSESLHTNEQANYRDLGLPMGMLELSEASIARKEIFIETFESMKAEEEETGAKAYFYGSHYSNPFYVSNFLMRLFPFSHISVELQGHKFDNPERLFLSVENAFNNSISMKTDVRELIPEFFYLPEMFHNINCLNLGRLESNELVNDVETPCKSNPYAFVILMREALESSYASFSIQKWIDLIFGYKQRGKEGEMAQNIFIGSSYEDQVNITTEENRLVLLHLVEFGLTPGQSFTKEFTSRNKKELNSKYKKVTRDNANLIAFITKNKNEKIVLPSSAKVIASQVLDKDKIIFLMGNFTIVTSKVSYSIIEKKFVSEVIKCSSTLNNKIKAAMHDYYKSTHDMNDKHIVIYNKGRSIALGGFSDDKITILSNIDTNMTVSYIHCSFDPSPISAIAYNEEEEMVFCGNHNGNVNVFKIENDKWILTKQLIDQTDLITNIYCCDELNLWASSSGNGYVNLYTLPSCNIVRSLFFKGRRIDYVFLSSCPLPCIVVYSAKNRFFQVYSINGEDLKREMQEDSENGIQSPIMLKDLFFNDYLAYIVNDTVTIRSIPLLFPIHKVSFSIDRPIACLTASEDYQTLYGISDDGNTIVVINDHKEKEDNNDGIY